MNDMPQNANTTDALFPVVYAQLRAVAAKASSAKPGASLHPTLLVHEVYLKLAKRDRQWENKAHFVATAARAMRQLLADRARKRATVKHGGAARQVTLTGVGSASQPLDLIAADRALNELETMRPRAAEVFILRALGGLTVSEAAAVLGRSERTVKSDWRFANSWLMTRLEDVQL